MKQLLTNLSNTINEELKIPLVSNEIEIKENSAECKKVILKSTRKQILAFSLDNNLTGRCKMFPFFNQTTSGINKVNDAIIFYINNKEIFVFIIELKSTNLGKYTKQLQAGKNFVLYLQGVLNNSFTSKYEIKEENIKCLVFNLRKTAIKCGTKRTSMPFEKVDGLNIVKLKCNGNYTIEQFI